MAHSLPDGLYDQLLTEDSALGLKQHVSEDQCTLEDLAPADGAQRLAEAVAEQLASVLQDMAPSQVDERTEKDGKQTRLQLQLEFVNAMLVDLRQRLSTQFPDRDYGANIRLLADPPKHLAAVAGLTSACSAEHQIAATA